MRLTINRFWYVVVQRRDWISIYLRELGPSPYVVSPLTFSVFSELSRSLSSSACLLTCHTVWFLLPLWSSKILCILRTLFVLVREEFSSPGARAILAKTSTISYF